MRHAVGDLLRHWLEGTKVEPRSLLWGILIGACVLSSLHLITMFATRWGNRRVTGKALLFSLMLHFGFLVGVVTVAPPPPIVPPGDPEGGDRTQRIDSSFRKLISNLDEYTKSYRALLEIVRKEKEILISSDLEKLKENNDAKEASLYKMKDQRSKNFENYLLGFLVESFNSIYITIGEEK